MILVVIRNYERETGAESHTADLMTQFNKIWGELILPETSTDRASLLDYFDFDFVLLPNKKYEEDRFDDEVRVRVRVRIKVRVGVRVGVSVSASVSVRVRVRVRVRSMWKIASMMRCDPTGALREP